MLRNYAIESAHKRYVATVTSWIKPNDVNEHVSKELEADQIVGGQTMRQVALVDHERGIFSTTNSGICELTPPARSMNRAAKFSDFIFQDRSCGSVGIPWPPSPIMAIRARCNL